MSSISVANPDDNFVTHLRNRPGCATAVATEGGAPIDYGASYAAIFPNNKIPIQCFDPTALDLMNQFVPLANIGNNQFQVVPTSSLRQDQFTVKIDHKIDDRHQLSVY